MRRAATGRDGQGLSSKVPREQSLQEARGDLVCIALIGRASCSNLIGQRKGWLMAVEDIGAQVLAAVGALGLGSVLGQYVATSRDRRQVSADALRALAEIERTRWALFAPGRPPTEATEFYQAVRTFQTAALLAGLPRLLVREYLVLAQAARWSSDDNLDTSDQAGIEARLADAVAGAAGILAEVTWRPVMSRRFAWRLSLMRVRRLRDDALGDTGNALYIERARQAVV
jgi:hypothetical protein